MKRPDIQTRTVSQTGDPKRSLCNHLSNTNPNVNPGAIPKKSVIVITDGEPAFGCIRAYLEKSRVFWLSQWFPNPAEALRSVLKQPPSLVLIGTKLRDDSGIELTHTLKRFLPRLIVVNLSEQAELSSFLRSFRAGADGYFIIPGTAVSFEEMLKDSLNEWRPFSKEVQKLLGERLATSALAALNGDLTRAEQNVISQMALGLTDKEIAAVSGVATATVHSIANHIYKKLDVHNRRQAVNAYLGFEGFSSTLRQDEPETNEIGLGTPHRNRKPSAISTRNVVPV